VAWLRQQLQALRAKRQFHEEYNSFSALSRTSGPRFDLVWRDRQPCLRDRMGSQGFDEHYVYHTAWAARVLAETRPAAHVDVSSSLYFCSIASAFVPIRFYDYRRVDLVLTGLTSDHADLTRLPFATASIESLSCMHVVEHVGLGRYGEPLDPDGDLKAIKELQRVVAPGGSLMVVVPIGQPRIRFNAHRIYSYRQVVEMFDVLTLREWALIPDQGGDTGPIRNATQAVADAQRYGCGCFWFTRVAQGPDC
jgi:SAM-dependent methyltransferase